jgi:hypothetical protein
MDYQFIWHFASPKEWWRLYVAGAGSIRQMPVEFSSNSTYTNDSYTNYYVCK